MIVALNLTEYREKMSVDEFAAALLASRFESGRRSAFLSSLKKEKPYEVNRRLILLISSSSQLSRNKRNKKICFVLSIFTSQAK